MSWLVGRQPQNLCMARGREAGKLPPINKHQEVLYQVDNTKWLPTMVTQIGPETCSYLIHNNICTMFQRNWKILNPVDLPATPMQSAKATIKCYGLPAPLSSSLKIQRPSTKCKHFTEPVLLINYRAVPPIPSVPDAPVTYLDGLTRLRCRWGFFPEWPLAWRWGCDSQEAISKETLWSEASRDSKVLPKHSKFHIRLQCAIPDISRSSKLP